jgi:hypothetical protein
MAFGIRGVLLNNYFFRCTHPAICINQWNNLTPCASIPAEALYGIPLLISVNIIARVASVIDSVTVGYDVEISLLM